MAIIVKVVTNQQGNIKAVFMKYKDAKDYSTRLEELTGKKFNIRSFKVLTKLPKTFTKNNKPKNKPNNKPRG